MQVTEHQYLHYQNVLVYETEVDPDTVLTIVKGIPDSLSVLGLQLEGKIIITYHGNYVEFLIPVGTSFSSNQHYQYKPEFKLVNAVRTRHYGSFMNIENKVEKLNTYIAEQSLLPITQPYYIVQNIENEIYDIYIGISENVL